MYCPKCNYDLRGQIDLRCPECGEPFDPAEPQFDVPIISLPAALLGLAILPGSFHLASLLGFATGQAAPGVIMLALVFALGVIPAFIAADSTVHTACNRAAAAGQPPPRLSIPLLTVAFYFAQLIVAIGPCAAFVTYRVW